MYPESWIGDEQKAAESELLALLKEDPAILERKQESLAITGIQSLEAVIALHAVTGVASGFAGKLFYEKWRHCTTRRKLNTLAAQIPLVSNLTERVDEEVIQRDVVEVLMLEGLSSPQAEYLTERIVARVKSRSAKGGSPPPAP